jgi:TonB-linked SusC/RagA family outer membrane protein
MKSLRLILVLATLALLRPGVALAALQAQHAVSGTVTNADTGGPLGGASVAVKGTAVGTITDAQGRYRLTAATPDGTLVFSRLGSASQEVLIDGRAAIDVALRPEVLALEGLTVIGYQTVQRERLTGAVSVVDVDDVRGTPASSPIEALQGRVPGLTISTSPEPVDEGASVRIRGVSTLGNNDPLYVIDGIPTKGTAAHRLRPDDIESIQVLKDAASASIYGSRSSNGVIVITTRSPLRQPLAIDYSGSVTASTYANRMDVLDTEQRGRALWQAAINDGLDPANLPIYQYDWERRSDGTAALNRVIVPQYVGDPAAGIRAADTDWYREISRTGVVQQHNLSAAASSERGGALLSLGLHDDEGIVRGTNFQRLNARINSSYSFLDGRLTIGENLALSRGAGTPMPSGLGGNPLALGLIAQPILPTRTESGGWAGPLGAGFDDRDNPVMLIDINTWDRNTVAHSFGNLFANFDVTPNLLATARLGVDWQNGLNRNIQRTYQAGYLRRDVNSLSTVPYQDVDVTFNSTLDYGLLAGRHSANVLGGFEALQSDFERISTFREGFALESEDYFVESAGTGRQTVSGERGGFSLMSFFGKLDYAFDDRYIASFTVRRDGSSRFGENNRYGTFPAVGLGWRISNEPFFPSGLVSDLKLRGSWGITGNQDIENNARFSLYIPNYGSDRTWEPGTGTAYDLGGSDTGVLPSGFFRVQTGNPNLRWESTTEVNVGLDFALLDNRLSGSFDYFDRTTEDILIRPAFIAVIGDGGARWLNGATVETEGAEVALGYRHARGDLSFGVEGNLGAFTNRITKLPQSVVRSYPGNVEQTILGHSMNSIFGYMVDGIFQDQAEVDAHAVQPGKAVGRLRYADLNDDGRIDALDQRFLGDANPDFSYGVSTSLAWRGLDVSAFLQGVQGPEIYNGIKTQTDFTSIFTGANFGTRVLDAWTPENPGSEIPALSLANTNDETRPSTYFVEDGSYLKLREVTVGYTLPQAGLPGPLSPVQGARLYLRGGNLVTFTNATTLPDPEVPFGGYPQPRTLSLGIDLSF